MRLTLAKQEESIKSLLSPEARMFTEEGTMVRTESRANSYGSTFVRDRTIVIAVGEQGGKVLDIMD